MANNTIDTLDIKIKSSSDEAIKNLDRLIGRLRIVQHTTGNVSGKSIANIGKGTASNLNKSATASKNLSTNLSSLPKQILGLNTNFGKFSQVAGSFYANCFLITRGIKKIGNAVNSAMDYVETYNYFNVSMDKIGKQFGKQYSEYGYDSAEEYANSFKSRLTDLMTKMTGYEVGDGGELKRSTTQTQNLSLDPEQLMNYQAKVAAVSNSVGMLGENTISTAKALSMLSADLSSLTNVPIESVMTNLQSGLIGQSRALYKYGIDITNNTLQELADANAITKKVSAMSQSEKMQLRVLAILQQSKIAWGDQANTINSVANQYRIFGQQTQNLSRILGNLFLPIVQYALPYINGMVIALQKLFETIGFKLWGDNWLTEVMDGISGGASDIDGLYDSIEDVGDATDDASKKAKKLKDNLNTLAIDKLNIISPKDKKSSKDEDGGTFDLSNQIGKAVSDYEKVWNKALKNSRNKAQEIANAIISAFQKGDYQGIGKYISNGLTKSLESIPWNTIYQKVGSFGTGLAQFLNGLITPELFYEVGRNIAKFLGLRVEFALNFFKELDWSNVGESIANGLNGFFENYPWADTAEALNKFVDGFEKALGSFISNINYKSVFKAFFDFFGNLEIDTILVIPMLKAFLKIKRGASKEFSSVGALIRKALSKVAGGIVSVKDNIKILGGKDGIKYTFLQGKDGIDNFRNGLSKTSRAILGAGGIIAAFAGTKTAIEGINDGSKTVLDGLGQIVISAGISAFALYTAFGPAGLAMAGISVLVGGIIGISKHIDSLNNKRIELQFSDKNGVTLDDLNEKLRNAFKSVKKLPKSFTDNMEKMSESTDTIKTSMDTITAIGSALKNSANTSMTSADKIKEAFKKLEDAAKQYLDSSYTNTITSLELNRTSLEAAGIDVDEQIKKATEAYSKNYNKLKKATKEYRKEIEAGRPNSEKANKNRQKIYGMTGMDNDKSKKIVDEAKKNISSKKLNINDVFDNSHKLDKSKLKKKFEEAKSVYNEQLKAVNEYWNSQINQKGISKEVKKTFENLQKLDQQELQEIFNKNYTQPLQQALNKSLNSGIDWDVIKKAINDGDLFKVEYLINNDRPTEFADDIVEIYNQIFNTVGGKGKRLAYQTTKDIISGFLVKNDSDLDATLKSDWKTFFLSVSKGISLEEARKEIQVKTISMLGRISLDEAKERLQGKIKDLFNIKSDFAFRLGFSVDETKSPKGKNQWFNKSFLDTIRNNDNIIRTTIKPIGYKANGGMVKSADLFYANENGNAELIGRYGNQTGVANQGQIVDAIEEASYRGHMRALASVGASQDQVIENHLTVELDGDVVAKKVSKANARNGAQIIGNQNGYVFG